DRLYHLAANHTHWDRQPERIATATVDGTRAVLGAAAKRRLAKIVVTSSWVTRGIHTEPVDETSEFNLRDTAPHIAAKLAAERAALKAADAGLPVVVVLPSFVVGPGDWKPTPSGALILEYLKTSPTFHFPVTTGGLSVADVDDIAAGHVAAMERGTVGERYLLGGENLNYESLFDTLSEVTGLPPPGRRLTPSALELRAVLMELRARWLGTVPLFTRSLARDLGHAQLYVNSAKAESELGYAHRPARTALARAARWYLDKGYVPERAARRIRLEPQLA
ncbi:MAG TPA: NAD-dependent epimerase/dehydratase family protein, partial [Polyangiaceae bacterium]